MSPGPAVLRSKVLADKGLVARFFLLETGL